MKVCHVALNDSVTSREAEAEKGRRSKAWLSQTSSSTTRDLQHKVIIIDQSPGLTYHICVPSAGAGTSTCCHLPRGQRSDSGVEFPADTCRIRVSQLVLGSSASPRTELNGLQNPGSWSYLKALSLYSDSKSGSVNATRLAISLFPAAAAHSRNDLVFWRTTFWRASTDTRFSDSVG